MQFNPIYQVKGTMTDSVLSSSKNVKNPNKPIEISFKAAINEKGEEVLEKGSYDPEKLMQIPFFEYYLRNFSDEIIISIKKSVFDYLYEKDFKIRGLILNNPEILNSANHFSDIIVALSFIHSVDIETLQGLFKQEILIQMTAKQAQKILEDLPYQENSKELRLVNRFLVEIARRIEIYSIYFKDEEELTVFYANFKKCIQEIFNLEERITQIETTVNRQIVPNHDSYQILAKHKIELKELKEKMQNFDLLLNVPMKRHYEVSQLCESEDAEIRQMAEKSKKFLDDYEKNLLKTYKKMGIDPLKRPDLWSFLVGPKAWLFESYGIKFPGDNRKAPFYHPSNPKQPLGYRLENHNAMKLEDELRSDLRELEVPVNEKRLITENDLLEKLERSLESQIKLNNILEALAKNNVSEIEKFITEFLELNSWSDLGIRPQNITLEVDKKALEEGYITGHICGWELWENIKPDLQNDSHHSETLNQFPNLFLLDTYEWGALINRKGVISDSKTTIQYLNLVKKANAQKIYNAQIEPLKTQLKDLINTDQKTSQSKIQQFIADILKINEWDQLGISAQNIALEIDKNCLDKGEISGSIWGCSIWENIERNIEFSQRKESHRIILYNFPNSFSININNFSAKISGDYDTETSLLYLKALEAHKATEFYTLETEFQLEL